MALQKKKIRYMTQLALLIAIQLMLEITGIGYIPIFGVIHITIMHIPVLVSAIVLGPAAGVILGTVFGLTSLIEAIKQPTLGTWPFNPTMTGSFSSVIIAVAPRILLGLVAALLFKALHKGGLRDRLAAGIAAAVGTACNTILVLGGVYLLLGARYAAEMGVDLRALGATFVATATTNGVVELIVAVLVCAALVTPLRKQVHAAQ